MLSANRLATLFTHRLAVCQIRNVSLTPFGAGGAARRPLSTPSTYEHVLHQSRMNKQVLNAEYAVRGKLVLMAEKLQEELKKPNSLPFKEITFCNIGNPQSVGQKPLTYVRQVMALLLNPILLDPDQLENTKKSFPADVVARAQLALTQTPSGFGAYSHSKGIPWIRKNVAKFIQERDGFPANPEDIYLTNGASAGISQLISMLCRDGNDGVMIPIPQYPLYSATLALCGATEIPYYLDEAKQWSTVNLEEAIRASKAKGVVPRGFTVINPGNPTGQVLSLENMKEIIRFCSKNKLLLLADEVYQANIYTERAPFHSFKKVLCEMIKTEKHLTDFELVSFHSTSKGYLGECGFRGGYMECVGIHPFVSEQIYKLVSISLCSNAPGQLVTELLVNPPKSGDASYELYLMEKNNILDSLGRRARKCAAAFNKMEGVSCNDAQGAMYLFPKFTPPAKAIQAAKEQGLVPDVHYCVELLNNTGVCVVPGSGFGQEPGTHHFRTTFLPPEDKMDSVLERMATFHAGYMIKYK